MNGRQLTTPYKNTDFDFLIVEMEHSLGHFYIFPSHILTKRGYLKTDFQKGKLSITIPPLTKCRAPTLWTKEYFDRFDFVTDNASSKQVVNN